MTEPSALQLLTEVLEGAMSSDRAASILRAVVASSAHVQQSLASGVVSPEVAEVLRARLAAELGPALADPLVDLVRARMASARHRPSTTAGSPVRGARRSASVLRAGAREPSGPRPLSGVRPKRRPAAEREAVAAGVGGSPDGEGNPAAEAGSARAAAPRADVTVLVVEDEPAVRMVFGRLLRRAGYQVVEASDGAEGLEKALLLRPAVVVSDYQMPRMNGQELAAELHRRLGAHAPAVALVTAITLLDAPPIGVALLRHKPLEPGELVAIVDQLCQQARSKCAGAGG